MPVPTSYTETTLAQFMHTKLGVVATAMNYTLPSSDAGVYAESVNDVLIAYGVSDIASASDMPKLRALAEREAWRKVMNETAGHYDVTADEQTFKRSQMHEQAKANFEIADAEAKRFDDEDSGYAVDIVGIVKPSSADDEGG